MDFTNKKVVVTGGSTGIGFATAKAFINAGASVWITGRSAPIPWFVSSRTFSMQNSKKIYFEIDRTPNLEQDCGFLI